MSIDLEKLSPEDREKLMKQLTEKQKSDKLKRKEDIATFKKLSEEFVTRNIEKLSCQQFKLEKLIEKLFKDYNAIAELKKSIYNTKDQDSHTSTLADGSASITIGYNVSIGFDGTESAGIQKIKDYIATLSGDSEKLQKLSKMVNTLLKPNAKTGVLNPSKIIELSKLKDEFNNDQFDEGLEIIFSAQIRRRNSVYVSGWKFIQLEDNRPKKVEFRFTV